MAQNYRRLGLAARLRAPTGGVEKSLNTKPTSVSKDPFAITTTEKAILSEAKVERDDDGNIIRILGRSKTTENPLNDPLNELDSDSDDGNDEQGNDNGAAQYEEWGGIQEDGTETDVVRTLIQEARNPAEKKPRYQSAREREWLRSLVDRYGDDTAAMARDRKLNPMQQTAADISRRLKKFKA